MQQLAKADIPKYVNTWTSEGFLWVYGACFLVIAVILFFTWLEKRNK